MTQALGLGAVEELAGQQVVLGFGHAHQQGPDGSGMVSGRDAEAHVPVGEAGALGGYGDVGQQRHREACAHGHAVDGGDDRLIQVDHVVDDVAGFLHGACDHLSVADGLLDHLEVAASREGVACASDDGHADLGVLAQVEPHPRKLVVQGKPGGVEHLGTVHGQEGNAVLFFDEQVLVAAVINHAL